MSVSNDGFNFSEWIDCSYWNKCKLVSKLQPHSQDYLGILKHFAILLYIKRDDIIYVCIMYIVYTGGWAKSQYPYVGLNSSVTECLIEIIFSGMTYYHHWFKKFVKSKHICVHFFQMKVHFRINLIIWMVGSSQISLDCVWPVELRLS